MINYRRTVSSAVMLFLLLICLGCSNEARNNEKIAYLSTSENSQYTKTFNDLHLGVLYDFNLRLPEADKSWVTLWVEGYKNGEKMVPDRLMELSYGLHPDEVVEGPLGFGIINHQSDKVSHFMYSKGASIPPNVIDNILASDGAEAINWGYAIGDDEVGLEDGETKVLGYYRQARNSIRTYDYQDANDITQMIKEDTVVLLLKIKVERKA